MGEAYEEQNKENEYQGQDFIGGNSDFDGSVPAARREFLLKYEAGYGRIGICCGT